MILCCFAQQGAWSTALAPKVSPSALFIRGRSVCLDLPILRKALLRRALVLKNKAMAQTDDRRDALLDAQEQIEDLDKRLNEAFKFDAATPETVEAKRNRLSSALMSVAIFVSKVIGQVHGGCFFELSVALADLNIGTIPNLLKASKKDSRTLDPTSLWCARAIVAARVFQLKKSKGRLSWKEAARQVAKDYPEIRQLLGKKAKDPATTIYNWHKEFSAKRIKNETARMQYEAWIEKLELP